MTRGASFVTDQAMDASWQSPQIDLPYPRSGFSVDISWSTTGAPTGYFCLQRKNAFDSWVEIAGTRAAVSSTNTADTTHTWQDDHCADVAIRVAYVRTSGGTGALAQAAYSSKTGE